MALTATKIPKKKRVYTHQDQQFGKMPPVKEICLKIWKIAG